jgi:hypothetical protein
VQQTAVTAGGYCNNDAGRGILSMELDPNLTKVNLKCVESTATANAYVICCTH